MRWPLPFLFPLLLILSGIAAHADARLSVLTDVLRLNEAARILSDEGIAQAQDLNEEMLGGQGGPGWQLQVERIYDPALMSEHVRTALGAALEGDALEEVIEFYATDLGGRIITLENEARIAIQDPDVEQAARARFAELEARDDPRLFRIRDLIETGDMITRNVTSAMNANYQFLRALADGGAIEMTEDEMLADAAGDIEERTEDTRGWLYGYLLMAYSPLEEEDLTRYLAFSETQAGLALNRALFEGFGKAYEDISYALGRAVALNMTAEEL